MLATPWKNPNGILLTKRAYQKVTFYLRNILVKTELQRGSAVARFRGVRLKTESRSESFGVTELFCNLTVVIAVQISTCVKSHGTVPTHPIH